MQKIAVYIILLNSNLFFYNDMQIYIIVNHELNILLHYVFKKPFIIFIYVKNHYLAIIKT